MMKDKRRRAIQFSKNAAKGDGEMSKRIYIRDDEGAAWYYDAESGRIKCLDAEIEGTVDNGYPCDGLEDGIRFLNENGYILVEAAK